MVTANCRSRTLSDDVGDLDIIGDSGGAGGAAGGQGPDEIRIIEPDANDKRQGNDVLGCHGESRGLHLAGRDRLQNALHLAAEYLPRPELERRLDGLARLNIPGIDRAISAPMSVSDLSMKAITGASGRSATRAPLRRPILVA